MSIYVWRDGKVVEIPPDELRARSILLGAESKYEALLLLNEPVV